MTSDTISTGRKGTRFMPALLWGVQILLTAIFLFTGLTKLLLPIPALEAQMPLYLPGALLRFIGLAETLGALGLVLPGLLRFRPGLTPLAAAGLVVIMVCATTYTILGGMAAEALMPFVVGLLAAFVAIGRTRLAPQSGPARLPILRAVKSNA
jgi:hypothetical protein